MIKTIIFDIGGVVVKTDFRAIYSNFAKRVGLSPEFVIEYHKNKKHELLLGNITLEQFWEDMKSAGANPNLDFSSIWIEEGLRYTEIDSVLLNIIAKLRRHYLVGTLTNLTPSRLLIDQKLDLRSRFDYAVLSCEEHLEKPDLAFYKLALAKANATAEEAVFVDDRQGYVDAAKSLGMNTILYTYQDTAELLKPLDVLGVKL